MQGMISCESRKWESLSIKSLQETFFFLFLASTPLERITYFDYLLFPSYISKSILSRLLIHPPPLHFNQVDLHEETNNICVDKSNSQVSCLHSWFIKQCLMACLEIFILLLLVYNTNLVFLYPPTPPMSPLLLKSSEADMTQD